jgi:hypothetical protein
MTIKIPEKNLADQILAFFGKKRAVKMPVDAYEKFGPHVYAKAPKESFWRALFRPAGQDPPPGYVYPPDSF